jgi:hypothetical protein
VTDHSKYFEEPLATRMEMKRDEARGRRRIAYDCFNAVVKGNVVVCAQGYFPTSIPLITVLRGRSSAACAKCPDYDDGGEAWG